MFISAYSLKVQSNRHGSGSHHICGQEAESDERGHSAGLLLSIQSKTSAMGWGHLNFGWVFPCRLSNLENLLQTYSSAGFNGVPKPVKLARINPTVCVGMYACVTGNM